MTKKQRDKALKNADLMDFCDGFTWLMGTGWCWFAIVGSTLNRDDLGLGMVVALAVSVVFVCLIRIRMLVRAIRVDALTREAEEEARREAGRP